MKAMIFAAGKGTRLRPLTDTMPKALIEINGTTLLEIVVQRLKLFGCTDVIINVHHFADQVTTFLKEKNNFGMQISISNESGFLLDTGGGLKKAAWFFSDNKPFLLHNVDIISNIDLGQLYNFHIKSKALATLAVKDRPTTRYFLFDHENELCGWENTATNEKKTTRGSTGVLTKYAFSGISVINPEIFKLFCEEGRFSLTDAYIRIAASKIIKGYSHNNSLWFDCGKLEDISIAGSILKQIK